MIDVLSLAGGLILGFFIGVVVGLVWGFSVKWKDD